MIKVLGTAALQILALPVWVVRDLVERPATKEERDELRSDTR